MSLLRRMRARRPRGVPATAGRLMASALVLLTALVLLGVSAAATTGGSRSEVCVGPVPVRGACTTTTTTTSSSTSTGTGSQSTGSVSTSTTGTQTETTTTAGSSTPAASTATGAASTSAGRPAATASPAAASRFPPPPPPLPPPSPGSVPVSPETVVQRIVMVPAAAGPIVPGETVEVQATLEAQRGTEIFAVPHVPVVFAVVAAAGGGAAVAPARVSSGESGVALVRVRTGDLPGDTVVSATSGAASAQLALHTDLPASGAAAHVGPPASGGAGAGSAGGHRLAWVGILAVTGILAAAVLGLLRRRWQG